MKAIKRFLVALVAALFAAPMLASAQQNNGPDYSTLLSSVNMGTTITAILAIAAVMMTVYVVWKGTKMVIRMFKGA